MGSSDYLYPVINSTINKGRRFSNNIKNKKKKKKMLALNYNIALLISLFKEKQLSCGQEKVNKASMKPSIYEEEEK